MPALLDTLLILLQMTCVVAVVAYLLTRSRFFNEFLQGHPSLSATLVTTGVFGVLSIYGTVSGVEVLGAPVNIRDLGPMVAGLACGPVVGIGAGIIGALYRLSLGGFSMYACSIATVLAGMLGGFVFLANKRQFLAIPVAVSFAVFIEGLHMLLVLGIGTPFAAAVELVATVAAPMILANAAGMFVFSFIITNLHAERKTEAEKENLVREIERKNAELRIAAEIQKSLLPETIPVVPGFEIAAASIPAREMDGDFYDMIAIGDDNPGSRTGLLIADVSGKGMPAALFMVLSRMTIRASAAHHHGPAEVLGDANGVISGDARSGMFVTAVYGVIDPVSRTLCYVNAGHNPPLLYREGNVAEFEGSGIALGATPGASYSSHVIGFSPGDIAVLFTDGVTEALNPAMELFGDDRLKSAILSAGNMKPGEIVDHILGEVHGFCKGAPQADDITLIVIKAG